jgi:hypothetical protein
MIRRLLLALLLMGSTLRADAGFYADTWYNLLQSGQGYNLVQTDSFIFITFFIYAEDGSPTFVIATLTYDEGTASYTGDLVATTGTFFGAPWVGATEATVGTATFTPSASNAYEGTLRRTAHALEGRLIAASMFGGCTESARFAALGRPQ